MKCIHCNCGPPGGVWYNSNYDKRIGKEDHNYQKENKNGRT